MVDIDNAEWVWTNIMDIYSDIGKDYFAVFGDLTIYSNDNYFECKISGMDQEFSVCIDYEITSGECSYSIFYNIGVSNMFYDKSLYISRLRVIFRDYRLTKLIGYG